MDRQQVFDYVKTAYGLAPDYPWKDDNAVLRHADNNKWFGVILAVKRGWLGLSGEGTMDVINVKCDPMLISSLREKEGYHAAYHMNKDKWISIRLDGSVPEDEIRNLIDFSFGLTETKKKSQ